MNTHLFDIFSFQEKLKFLVDTLVWYSWCDCSCTFNGLNWLIYLTLWHLHAIHRRSSVYLLFYQQLFGWCRRIEIWWRLVLTSKLQLFLLKGLRIDYDLLLAWSLWIAHMRGQVCLWVRYNSWARAWSSTRNLLCLSMCTWTILTLMSSWYHTWLGRNLLVSLYYVVVGNVEVFLAFRTV